MPHTESPQKPTYPQTTVADFEEALRDAILVKTQVELLLRCANAWGTDGRERDISQDGAESNADFVDVLIDAYRQAEKSISKVCARLPVHGPCPKVWDIDVPTYHEAILAVAGFILTRLKSAIRDFSNRSFPSRRQCLAEPVLLLDELARIKSDVLDANFRFEAGAVRETREAIRAIEPQPAPTAPPAGGNTGEGEPLTGAERDKTFQLRQFARAELKGQERAVIEALCDADGELPIADLAVKDGVGWDDANKGFESAQRRLNRKIKKQRWKLTRLNNAARLTHLPV